MTPEELLDTANDAASYFVKSSNTKVSHRNLQGYTTEDLSMDIVEKILCSALPLEDLTKTYVYKTARSVAIDLIKTNTATTDTVDTKVPEIAVPLMSFDDVENGLYKYLGSESADDSDVYVAALYLGLSDASVGEHLDVSPRTVRRRVGALKLKIEEHLSV